MMKGQIRSAASAAGLLTAFLSQPALAQTDTANQDQKGHIQVKLLTTVVAPNDKIKRIDDPNNLLGPSVVAGARSRISNNVVPTAAVEYFLTNSISVETICCMTEHQVHGGGTLAGASLVKDVKIIPATFTLKYHLPLQGIKPYVGLGPTYFLFVEDRAGSTAKALGATSAKINDKVGLALQAGFDVPINSKFFLSADAKRYFVTTTTYWYAQGTEALSARVRLDPWVVSAGVGVRF